MISKNVWVVVKIALKVANQSMVGYLNRPVVQLSYLLVDLFDMRSSLKQFPVKLCLVFLQVLYYLFSLSQLGGQVAQSLRFLDTHTGP